MRPNFKRRTGFCERTWVNKQVLKKRYRTNKCFKSSVKNNIIHDEGSFFKFNVYNTTLDTLLSQLIKRFQLKKK